MTTHPKPKGILLNWQLPYALSLPVGGVMQWRVPMKVQPVIDSAIGKPPHRPGDVVFGKEAWRFYGRVRAQGFEGGFEYRSDLSHRVFTEFDDPHGVFNLALIAWNAGSIRKWRPPQTMREEYARLFFRVQSVRVERVQDISEADAVVSGIVPETCMDLAAFQPGDMPQRVWRPQFAEHWDTQHGKKHPWANNDYCWVNVLERIERT